MFFHYPEVAKNTYISPSLMQDNSTSFLNLRVHKYVEKNIRYYSRGEERESTT